MKTTACAVTVPLFRMATGFFPLRYLVEGPTPGDQRLRWWEDGKWMAAISGETPPSFPASISAPRTSSSDTARGAWGPALAAARISARAISGRSRGVLIINLGRDCEERKGQAQG